MKEYNEAVIVLCKCPKTHRSYGIRAESLGKDHWSFTWAFPMREDAAHHEGYDKTSIKGRIESSEEYPGCPFCGTDHFVVCECGHMNCNYLVNGKFRCEWCGRQGTLEAYGGGRISAGMDA